MGNKDNKRRKSSLARSKINKKNAIHGHAKKSVEQPQKIITGSLVAKKSPIVSEKNMHSNNITPDASTHDILSKNSSVSVDSAHLEQPNEVEDLLIVEEEIKEHEFKPVSGRRLVDINYIFKELQEKAQHNGLFNCGLSQFKLTSEKRHGLWSRFRFECQLCKEVCIIKSEDPNSDEQVNINIAAASGIIASGIGYSQFEELCSAMDVPVFSSTSFLKLQDEVFSKWTETASASMEAAAKMEKDIAISEGRVKNGYPVVDVKVDGSWCARSYGSNQKASSGAAAIIGRRTGKVLFIGVKNKYCLVCARAANKYMPPKEHKCFKNYEGSASSMEKEIIVEGFKASILMYGMIFGRMIADGDSSTYAAILKAKPYEKEGVTVEKIECRNHILRNFCKKLRTTTTETKYALAHRKMLNDVKIMTMRKAIVESINHHKNSDSPRNVAISCLHNDITNCVSHAFGDHRMCQEYNCTKDKNDSETQLKTIQNTTFMFRVNSIVSNIAAKSRSLIEDVDTNAVECFNNVIAKFIGGKRANFALKGSYEGRCSAAVVSFNTQNAISKVQKAFLSRSPKGRVKFIEKRRAQKRKLNLEHPIKKKKKLNAVHEKQHDYGPASSAPDMSPQELEKAKEEFIDNLKTLTADRHAVERATVLQRDSSEWLDIRKNLVTASNFGQICKRKIKINTAPLVKSILYQKNLTRLAGIAHGIENERQALQQLQKQENIDIMPCGLFIDKTYPFMGATPDGLVGEDMVVEIKCPLVAAKMGITSAIQKNKIQILKYDNKTDTNTINKNSNWYYQIQGQLHITERRVCILGIWSGENEPLLTKKIERDDNFWKTLMEPKLVKFFTKCLLPEIVDSRHARGMPIRTLTLEDDDGKKIIDSLEGTCLTPSQLQPEYVIDDDDVENIDSIDCSYTLATKQQPENSSHVNSPLVSLDSLLNLQPGPSTREINFKEF